MKKNKSLRNRLAALFSVLMITGPTILNGQVLVYAESSISEQSNTKESEDKNRAEVELELHDTIPVDEETDTASTIKDNNSDSGDENTVHTFDETSSDLESDKPTSESEVSEPAIQEESEKNVETVDPEIEGEPSEEKNLNSESETTVPEEYYSAEETREAALKAMNESSIQSQVRTLSVPYTTAYINAVSDLAIEIGNQYNLYPSVLIAQSALESNYGRSVLSYNPNFNYFGIKGSHNGNSFYQWSKEYINNQYEYVQSEFKLFGSPKESFIDAATRINKGPDWERKEGSWDPNRYTGALKNNASNYKEAAQGLSGWATDPSYSDKIIKVIESYGLTKYDNSESTGKQDNEVIKEIQEYNSIKSSKDIKYSGTLNTLTGAIYTQPQGIQGSKIIRSASEFYGKEVKVTKEVVTEDGTWSLVDVFRNGVKGWVRKEHINIEKVTSSRSTQYEAKIKGSSNSIDTLPYGTEGYQYITSSGKYLGANVRVYEEKVTKRATWAYISILGKGVTGWIDKKALDIERVTSSKDIRYEAKLARSGDTITTKPWGTDGFETISNSSSFVGKSVRIYKEQVTRRATWAYISVLGEGVAGWIDKRALDIEKVTSSKDIRYEAKLARSGDTITTKPWGTEGFETVASTNSFVGKNIRVYKEQVTRRATWAYISVLGEGISGWIDKRALDIERITSSKPVNYWATIARKGDTITTTPWGTEGYKTLLNTNDSSIFGTRVTVIREAKTRRATWALIKINGKQGWIDIKALRYKFLIYIDPGHGGTDSGASQQGVHEKNINFSTAKFLNDLLVSRGYEVVMSRNNDKTVSLSQRTTEANKLAADIFVSIHNNSMGVSNSTARGIETFIHHRVSSGFGQESDRSKFKLEDPRIYDSLRLADFIHPLLINRLNMYDRGVKGNNFHVLRETNMPAILLELGFMDNPTELNKIKQTSYHQNAARAVADGIDRYFNK